MNHYELVLRGGVALFEASEQVTRGEWRTYVRALRFQNDYPGIQGLGFSRRIPRAEKAAHEAAVRAEGYASYAITPEGERDEYNAIVYLEPFDARNQRAFGFAHRQATSVQAGASPT